MKKRFQFAINSILFVFMVLSSYMSTYAQCDVIDIAFNEDACINETISIDNQTPTSGNYIWDFCARDLNEVPSGQLLVATSLVDKVYSLKIIEYQGSWYGFAVGSFSKKLVRLDFGSDLSNTPSIVDLGGYGEFNFPQDIDLITEDGVLFALVANTNASNLTLLDFSNGIESSPLATNVDVTGLSAPYNIDIVEDGDNKYAFVTNDATTELSRMDFGNSITNAPSNVENFAITGGSDIRGIQLIKECDSWYGLIISQFNKKAFKLSFGTDITSSPSLEEINLGVGSTTLSLVHEGGSFYAFCQATNGQVIKIDFVETMENAGTVTNLGDFGLSTNVRALTLVGVNSKWFGFNIDLAGRAIQRLDFPDDCTILSPTSTVPDPASILYATEGRKYVTAVLESNTGEIYYFLDSVDVSSNTSPDIDFSINENLCVSTNFEYASINISGDITSHFWNFGDGNTSTDPNPSHTYAAGGEYEVELQVQSTNGCNNFTRQTIKIYGEPVPDFTLPSGTICTNEEYTFINNTADDFDGNLSYDWKVDGVSVGTDRDLIYQFPLGGAKEIKLITAIPGCSTEQIQTIPTVEEGAIPAFIAQNNCMSSPINFTNESSGGESYMWDFDDGNTSSEPNPSHQYSVSGTYDVSLSVTNSVGCITTTQNQVFAYAMPIASFSNDISCSSSITSFTDNSIIDATSNIVERTWNIDDGATYSTENPEHIFENAGKHDVTLHVVTNNGCESTITRTIDVYESPIAQFEIEEHCIGDDFIFTNNSTSQNGNTLEWSINGKVFTEEEVYLALNEAKDYEVSITVKTTDGCFDTEVQTITVDPLPKASFTTDNLCEGKNTLFIENSSTPNDEVIKWQWSIDGEPVGIDKILTTTFSRADEYTVLLEAETAKGCKIKSDETIVDIYENPIAKFEVSENIGSPPLTVNFSNQSEGSTNYLWDFGGVGNSIQTNPQFIFNDFGTYEVELTAINKFGCDEVFSKTVYVVNPYIDLDLVSLNQVSSGYYIFTIANNSNIPISTFSMQVDLGGFIEIQEKFDSELLPGEVKNHTMGFSIPTEQEIAYLCFELQVENSPYSENKLNNNSKCISLEQDGAEVISVYPNPAKNELYIPIVAKQDEVFDMKIIDVNGKIVQSKSYSAIKEGLITLELDLELLQQGIYILQLRVGDNLHSEKILVE